MHIHAHTHTLTYTHALLSYSSDPYAGPEQLVGMKDELIAVSLRVYNGNRIVGIGSSHDRIRGEQWPAVLTKIHEFVM